MKLCNPVQYYDECTQNWTILNKFPAVPKNAVLPDSVVSVKGELYVSSTAGDSHNPAFVKLTHPCANFPVGRWQVLPHIPTVRPCPHPLLHVNGNIYAIGGAEKGGLCEVFCINTNSWGSMAPIPKPWKSSGSGQMMGEVYGEKIIMYNSMTMRNKEDRTPPTHFLQMYDPLKDEWAVLGSWQHPALYAGLVVEDGKCYRVVNADCKCEEEGCKWHGTSVQELIVDVANQSAVSGELQSQDRIPRQYGMRAFCISQALYVVSNDCRFHRIDGVIGSDQLDLDAWNGLITLGDEFSSTVTLRFDKAKCL